jgi:RNA polymerase sigma-70 factor, ECF subfamily
MTRAGEFEQLRPLLFAIFRDRDNKVLFTLALDILDGQIQVIRSVSNPGKLGHVGPVADAWAVARQANQARRPTD